MSKLSIRKEIKELKRNLTQDQIHSKSHEIFVKLKECKEFLDSQNIYIYRNYNQEVITVDIIKLCQLLNKNVFLPKIVDDKMFFVKYTTDDKLKKNTYGILEPDCTDYDTLCSGLLIMPLLAFDDKFNRLGYGGGYYDRYLNAHPDNIKLGLAYEFQKIVEIPVEEFDIPLDIVITEKDVYRKKRTNYDRFKSNM